MNLETYIREVIQEEVRTVVREELVEVMDEIKASKQNREPKQHPGMPKKYIIRPNELCKMLAVSRSTLWRMENVGRLPDRVKIGPRTVGWYNTDIEEWLEQNRRNPDS
ncbi:helix-turn-helix transcriptional regulator [Natronogracilivirga saccharolytica]|uniref:AlpA family phage regulatory protein n=1 Tax=Natronogracilivirga saccharolytica TaxID=2812953 RepID=A0A8J7UWL1_9BACT|nr:AlpA family phage regulatory protein [Natronogracilivirga saccharolytica]MBP3193786.1 AlpA family phage regulatory protein [Natronogracilivirga saccharolytica]